MAPIMPITTPKPTGILKMFYKSMPFIPHMLEMNVRGVTAPNANMKSLKIA
jgi:hypothetical protein